jgi:hypothetical protein
MQDTTTAPKEVTAKTDAETRDQPKKVILTAHQAQLKAQWEASPNRFGARAPIFLDKEGNPVWLNRRSRRYQDKVLRIKSKYQSKKAA